jgi:hypothetical protein
LESPCGCGHAAGVFEQEQHVSVNAASIRVEPGREVRVAPGVYLLDQPVQRRHMAIVDTPSFVRDDIREAVRLWQEESRVGDHPYSMVEVAATSDGEKSVNITGSSVMYVVSQPE